MRAKYESNGAFRTSCGASIWSTQNLMTCLLEGRDSAGRFAVEHRLRQGSEPPPHVHTHENEFLYVLEGHLVVFVDERRLFVGPGGCVFLPRGKPHAFRITSPTARLLAIIAPAGLEGFFRALGEPAATPDFPVEEPMASEADVAEFAEIYGLKFLSEAEIAERLPAMRGRQQRDGPRQ